jgi:signal transduction histidine kinase
MGALRLPDSVEISFSDTGLASARRISRHLFEEFRQVDCDIAREHNGTGLGLALTKRFVELHGGQIRLTSEVGKGSVFTLILPLVLPAEVMTGHSLALADVKGAV